MLPCPWSTLQHLAGNGNICCLTPTPTRRESAFTYRKQWPGGDGKGRLSSEGLAAFPGFATSSLEYPWPALFTSECLSLSGAAGSCPSLLCSVSAGCLALLILPDPRRHLGKVTPFFFGHFFIAGSSSPREFGRQGVLLNGSMYKYSVSADSGLSFWLLWVWDVRVGTMELGECGPLASPPDLSQRALDFSLCWFCIWVTSGFQKRGVAGG